MQRTELLDCGIDDLLPADLVPDVLRERERGARPLRVELRGKLLDARGIHIGHNYTRSLARERLGVSPTQSTRRASDDRDLAFYSCHVCVPRAIVFL